MRLRKHRKREKKRGSGKMTYREAWEMLKPTLKAHIDGDKELMLAFVKVNEAVESKERMSRQKTTEFREAVAC